jgi:hypothetical protein
LEDSVVTEMIQEEFVKQKYDDDDDDMADPEWPGFEALLPIHKFEKK